MTLRDHFLIEIMRTVEHMMALKPTTPITMPSNDMAWMLATIIVLSARASLDSVVK